MTEPATQELSDQTPVEVPAAPATPEPAAPVEPDVSRETISTLNAELEALKAQNDTLVASVLKALGKGDEVEAVTVDQLATELAAERVRAKGLELREAVREAASGVEGADPARLLSHIGFLAAAQALDDQTALPGLIAETIAQHTWLAVAKQPPAPPSASGPAPSPEKLGGVTAEQFSSMDGSARQALYARDPATFRRLAGL